MTKSQTLELLRSGYVKVHRIAIEMYDDKVSANTKRGRLKWKIENGSLNDEEIEKINKLFKDFF